MHGSAQIESDREAVFQQMALLDDLSEPTTDYLAKRAAVEAKLNMFKSGLYLRRSNARVKTCLNCTMEQS